MHCHRLSSSVQHKPSAGHRSEFPMSTYPYDQIAGGPKGLLMASFHRDHTIRSVMLRGKMPSLSERWLCAAETRIEHQAARDRSGQHESVANELIAAGLLQSVVIGRHRLEPRIGRARWSGGALEASKHRHDRANSGAVHQTVSAPSGRRARRPAMEKPPTYSPRGLAKARRTHTIRALDEFALPVTGLAAPDCAGFGAHRSTYRRRSRSSTVGVSPSRPPPHGRSSRGQVGGGSSARAICSAPPLSSSSSAVRDGRSNSPAVPGTSSLHRCGSIRGSLTRSTS